MRKFVIGLVVFGVLLALYVGYTRLSGTGPSGLATPEPQPILEADALKESSGRGGRIGDTEIIGVEHTRLLHRGPDGGVDREFGFEVLLHKQGDRWQLSNPYMTLYLPKVRCDVRAATGEVQVQTVFRQLVPSDALFRGNVVIHIVPPKRNDPRECFIYLDDVVFVAEKSLFSSTGPVRFVSRSAVLEGVGMELIYDSLQSRLELFRIIDLKSLRIRSADVALFSGDKEAVKRERGGSPGQATTAAQGPAGVQSATAAPAFYECILRRNATIDTPRRSVMARHLLVITDIPWAGSFEEPSADRAANEPSEPDIAEMPLPEPFDTKASRQVAFDTMPPESFDIVVTCEGDLVVAPKDASGQYLDPNGTTQSAGGVSPSLDLQSRREQAIAQRVEYNATTGDGMLAGPVQMVALLDPNALGGPGSGFAAGESSSGEPMLLTVTARDAVRYLSASNRIIFDGNCVASVEKKDPNITHEITLSAPTFALDLGEDVSAPTVKKTASRAITLERFSTTGGQASLAVRRRAGGLLLGWTQVLASQLEYEAASRLFTARGEGELRLNNAQITQRHTDPNAFGFNQPCYAFLREFDELVFAPDTNRITVAAQSRPMLIDYIPVIDGKYGQHIRGDAGHLDLTLRRTETGRTEIASLVASRGVTYEDQTTRFAGGTLTYDGDKSLVTVVGDETQPCYFNGAPVDQIEMDIKTSTLKTQLRGLTTIQGKR